MNIKRAIGGILLSFVFLSFFAYMFFGVNWIFENYFQSTSKEEFLGSMSQTAQAFVPENTNINDNTVLPIPTPANPISYSKPEINSKSAVSIESNLSGFSKTIFEKDSNAQLPIASLTKLMTAVVVLDNYNLTDVISVDKISDAQSPMKQDVKLGDRMSVKNLLEIMLVSSSNKSAYALSEGPSQSMGRPAFVDLMNQKAREIGLQSTFFADPTGLSSKNVSTAGDIAKLAEYILKKYPEIAAISKSKELYVPGLGTIQNTDQLLGEIPDVVCSKTGFTNEADGCLLLVTNGKDGNYLINVILGADDRFFEMQKLINIYDSACKSS